MKQFSNSRSQRIEWVDAAKGIGALLVVLGHTYGIPNWFHASIYSFHMPQLFILTGITIHPNMYSGG